MDFFQDSKRALFDSGMIFFARIWPFSFERAFLAPKSLFCYSNGPFWLERCNFTLKYIISQISLIPFLVSGALLGDLDLDPLAAPLGLRGSVLGRSLPRKMTVKPVSNCHRRAKRLETEATSELVLTRL